MPFVAGPLTATPSDARSLQPKCKKSSVEVDETVRKLITLELTRIVTRLSGLSPLSTDLSPIGLCLKLSYFKVMDQEALVKIVAR